MQEVRNAFPENITDFIICKNMPLQSFNKSLGKKIRDRTRWYEIWIATRTFSNLNTEFPSIQHQGRFNDAWGTVFHMQEIGYRKNDRAQRRGWKEYNNGIHDVMLSSSFLKASDPFSHPAFDVSAACPPYFNFHFIIKSMCLPTSSIFVQRWQHSRGKFVFNSDSADVACLLFASCFLCVFAYKVVASATVGKIGNCLLYFIISLPRDFSKATREEGRSSERK